MDSLRIVLNHTEATFLPGSAICGHLRTVLTKQVGINSISLGVFGKAETKFTQSSEDAAFVSGSSGLAASEFSDTQTIIDKRKTLWKPKSTARNLKPGVHCFPFVFRLPLRCPPTFEGNSGRIQYELKGYVELHWAAEKSCTLPFVVLQNNELAIAQEATKPYVEDFQRNCKLLFWSYGTISAKVEMEKRSFIPGEKVVVLVTVKNGTSRLLENIRLKLVQYITYKAYLTDPADESIEQQTECSEENNVLFDDKKNARVLPREEKKVEFSYELPQVTPSFNLCRIINVNYEMHVILGGGVLSQKIKLEVPIVVLSTISQASIDTLLENTKAAFYSGITNSSSIIAHTPVDSPATF